MDHDASLRTHLRKLLDWEDAHVSFDTAVDGIARAQRGVVPKGLPHSLWQLVEHLQRTQDDILRFCRNPGYVEPPHEEYCPSSVAPPNVDLLARIPHGSGQTYLRELLLVADHNAYHVAQVVLVGRSLGIWTHP